MRVLTAVALTLLLLEAVLAGACCAGYWWLGGGWGGTALVVAVVLLIVGPWLGDLCVDFDSRPAKLEVRVAWWAAMRMNLKTQEGRFRFLFISWRTQAKGRAKPKPKPAPTEAEKPARLDRARTIGRHAGGLTRMALAALQALFTLLGEARELRLRVQSPTEIDTLDRVLAGVVQSQEIGPLDLSLATGGKRRIEAHYRIGLLRAFLAAWYAYLEGRPVRTIRALRAERAAAEPVSEEGE